MKEYALKSMTVAGVLPFATQDLTGVQHGYDEQRDETTVAFTRKLWPGDDRQNISGSALVPVIWAYGQADNWGKHAQAGHVLVDFQLGTTTATPQVPISTATTAAHGIATTSGTPPQQLALDPLLSVSWTVDTMAKEVTLHARLAREAW